MGTWICCVAFIRRATSSSCIFVVSTLALSSAPSYKISIVAVWLLEVSVGRKLMGAALFAGETTGGWGVFAPCIVPMEKSSSKGTATLGFAYAFVLLFLPELSPLRISLTQSWFSNSATYAASD